MVYSETNQLSSEFYFYIYSTIVHSMYNSIYETYSTVLELSRMNLHIVLLTDSALAIAKEQRITNLTVVPVLIKIILV